MNDLKKQELGKFIIDLAISIVLGAIVTVTLQEQAQRFTDKVLVFYVTMSAYWGWKYLSIVQPKMFMVMPLFGWLLYFAIKIAISMFAGVFVMPYQTIKMIMNLKK